MDGYKNMHLFEMQAKQTPFEFYLQDTLAQVGHQCLSFLVT